MAKRRILTAELLSIGSELTFGETRDTNAGDLARSLTGLGVAVERIQALPDRLAVVHAAMTAAIERVDLVVTTGGLGPTPDDLTREAVAAALGQTPAVDPELERWLRTMWDRRGVPFPEMNVKQAWLIPAASPLPNPNGTAPGWWVERADGGIVVCLPGPPREMRPMWSDHVLPRLAAHGAGAEIASRTLRLAGIGESQLADLLGEELLRAPDPVVATYARADAVDVRISSYGDRAAAERVAATAERIVALVARNIWAEGETTWAEAVGVALDERGLSLTVVEVATGGSLAVLLGDQPWLRLTESLADDAPAAAGHRDPAGLEALARNGMHVGGAPVGIAVRARPRGADTAVSVVVVGPGWVHRERRIVFLGGANGRLRSALGAVHILLSAIRARPPG
ncbi:MAG TPA: molybdopterin-binding protein [Candidatus Limnocylindrales bacterium]|nr:molybdopterin-binding protein [Candidatus Limnocylindrales bacterium]